MRLNKLGHGLAVSAVSALVISGLTLSASPALAADVSGVRLLSQQDGIASTRVDGDFFSSAVTLAAEQLDPAATISFEVNADPAATNESDGWVAIVPASTATQGPYVTAEWIPDAALVDTSIALRAVATTATTTTYSTRNDVALTGSASAVNSVSLGSTGAFFAQPYADSSRTSSLMAVSGNTSAADGTVQLSAWNPTSGAFEGTTEAAVSFLPTKLPGGGFGFLGQFTGTLDITPFDAANGDVLALRAERDSDSVRPTLLEAQTLTSMSVYGVGFSGPETTPVTLAVLDQGGRAVIGAEVRRSSDGTLVGYTGARGLVDAAQPSGTTETYYANTTDTDAFEEGVDIRTDPVEVAPYVPVTTATEAEFADGTVFDDQEYADGDIALQVVDGRGDPFAAEEELSYRLYPSGEEPPAEPTTATTDADGRLVVPFDPAGADGEYTLTFSAPGSVGGGEQEPVTFVAGDAVLGLTPLAGTAPSGGSIAYEGTLTVEGEPLADRDIELAYTRGAEQAPGTEADAGLGDQRTLQGQTTSGDDGTFTVTVADVVEAGGPAETGGKLKVMVLDDTVDATADFTQVVTPTTPTTTPPTTTPTPAPTTPAPGKITVALRLKGSDAGAESDRLRVLGPASVAGQKARIHVQAPGGSWRVVKSVELDDTGDATVTLPDANGNRVTRYRVRLIPNHVAKAFTSGALRLR